VDSIVGAKSMSLCKLCGSSNEAACYLKSYVVFPVGLKFPDRVIVLAPGQPSLAAPASEGCTGLDIGDRGCCDGFGTSNRFTNRK